MHTTGSKSGMEFRPMVVELMYTVAVVVQQVAMVADSLPRQVSQQLAMVENGLVTVATLEQAADLDPANGTVQAHLEKARERLRETTAKAEAEARAIEAPPSDKTRPLEPADLSDQVTDRTIVLPAAQVMAAVVSEE